MMYRLTARGWIITICTLGLAFPVLWLLRPRSQPSPFKYTGEYLSKIDKR
jgi:hypothetical protein